MRHFATHGWLVAAPDHKDNTLAGAVDPLPTKHYFERPLDIRATIDALQALPASDALAGKLDTQRVVLSGHSFGCYTTWASAGASYDIESVRAACEAGEFPAKVCTEDEIAAFETDLSDPRVAAILPMAGAANKTFFGEDGVNAVGMPVLFLTGGDDDVGGAALFDAISGVDMTWIDIAGGCHQLFGFGNCTGISDEVGFPIVNAYALAFARRHLLADDDPVVASILDGSHEISPKVTFKKK
jgi:predicted dienelactone hydrolase